MNTPDLAPVRFRNPARFRLDHPGDMPRFLAMAEGGVWLGIIREDFQSEDFPTQNIFERGDPQAEEEARIRGFEGKWEHLIP